MLAVNKTRVTVILAFMNKYSTWLRWAKYFSRKRLYAKRTLSFVLLN